MSLMFVLDQKQTLYLWRQAKPDIAENLSTLLGESTQKGTIQTNYRSPKQLVLLSNYFSEIFEEHRMEVVRSKPYKPVTKGCLAYRIFDTSHQEIRYLIKDIKELNASGVPWKNISILSRNNRSLLDLEAGLISGKVPYIVKYDSRSILNQSPFKVMYSLYSLLFNPKDIYSLCEILLPLKGIGPKFLEELKRNFRTALIKNPMVNIYRTILNSKGTSKQWRTAKDFITQVLLPIEKIFEKSSFSFLMFNREVWGILTHLIRFEKSKDGNGIFSMSIEFNQFQKVFHILNNIYYVLSEDSEFRRKTEAQKFLDVYQSLSLSQEHYTNILHDKRTRNDDGNRVFCGTIHGFKGKQNEYIYITNLRPAFPVSRNDFEAKCCFYVAVTRATKKLTLSCAENVLTYAGKLMSSPENPLLNHYMNGIEKLKQELEGG